MYDACIGDLLTDRETNRQMDKRNPPSLLFCPFLNIPDSSTRTIKAVYSTYMYVYESI